MKRKPLPKKRGRPKLVKALPSRRSNLATPMVMNDIKPFVNVANPEREHWISSRSELRSFERSFGCYQTGKDFPVGTVASKNEAKLKAREELAKGIDGGWA